MEKGKINILNSAELKMNKEEISRILKKWWNDNNTCSGKPHCDVEECDLCFTCFKELCGKFGLEVAV
jgi:hypothetical protein